MVKGEGLGEEEVVMKVMTVSSALNGCHPDSAGSSRPGGYHRHQPEEEEEPAGEGVVGSEYYQVEVVEEVKELLWGNQFHRLFSTANKEKCGQLGGPQEQMEGKISLQMWWGTRQQTWEHNHHPISHQICPPWTS